MSQAYYSPISINAAQVPSTQTDFPVLVSQTDARFKTIGNSGHVANANGFDIRPYSDSGLTTAITGYRLHRYNATTGEVIMRVKVGSLSSSTTPIYLGYGDSSLTTDGSSTTCFSNGYLDFYPFSDGTTLSVSSMTGTHNGTNHSATAAAGQVDGCASFASASSQYVDIGSQTITAPLTISGWVNGASFPNAYNSTLFSNVTNSAYAGIFVKSNGKVAWFVSPVGVAQDGTGSHTLSTATWYYLTMVYDATSGLVGYVNAASDATHSANGGLSFTAQTDIGRDNVNAGRFWNGGLDEIRTCTVVRSANWITTEYNNEVAPGTFETLGSEVAFTATSTGNMFLVM